MEIEKQQGEIIAANAQVYVNKWQRMSIEVSSTNFVTRLPLVPNAVNLLLLLFIDAITLSSK